MPNSEPTQLDRIEALLHTLIQALSEDDSDDQPVIGMDGSVIAERPEGLEL